MCVCVSDCCLQSLTRGPLLTPLSVSQVGAEACSGVSVCVCVCMSIYIFFLPLPVCQKCVSPITCLSDITVECGNAHLTHCLRRSSRGVCVFTPLTRSESAMPSAMGAQNYPAPKDLLC